MENYCINCQKKKKKKSQTGNKCWDSLWHPVQAMLQQTFNFAHVLFYCLFHRSMSVFNVLSRMEKPCQFLMEFQFHELPLLTQQTLVTRGSRPGEVNLNTSDWLPSQLPQAHFTSDLPACIHSCSSAFPLLCLLRFVFFFKIYFCHSLKNKIKLYVWLIVSWANVTERKMFMIISLVCKCKIINHVDVDLDNMTNN